MSSERAMSKWVQTESDPLQKKVLTHTPPLCLETFLASAQGMKAPSFCPVPTAQAGRTSYFKGKRWHVGCSLPAGGQFTSQHVAESLRELGENLNIIQAALH